MLRVKMSATRGEVRGKGRSADHMKTLSLGYSPCPNDTFIFYALVHGKVDTKNLSFHETLCDIETLNRKAIGSALDLTKISYHAFGHVRKNYCLLRAGSALGKGCGPLLVAKNEYSSDELKTGKIAIPGKLTTAFLLLQLFDPAFSTQNSRFIEMPFNEIINAVANEAADAGLIIHESRFTYRSYGLKKIIDLGEWWEEQTGLPIPLGGILGKRTLGEGLHKKINRTIKESVSYAFNHRNEPMEYIKKHSQELSEEVINQHIGLYVNDYSLDMGKDGEKAVTELLSRAEEAGIIPRVKQDIFF